MTSLAQLLIDADKTVKGSDVAADFVTQDILQRLPVEIQVGFSDELPAETDCVIYTAAHQAQQNPQVKQAQIQNISIFSQAEAVAQFFNQKRGIAVCGVGGKSTTSAMLTWILEKTKQPVSYSVGVGNIPQLERTGRWHPASDWFVIEADEYVINPAAIKTGAEPIPRFSFLEPEIIVCTNFIYDHPDVYQDFAQTQVVFNNFFQKAKTLIIKQSDLDQLEKTSAKIVTFGEQLNENREDQPDLALSSYQSHDGQSSSQFVYQGQEYKLQLQVPGRYNVLNALAAILAGLQLGLEPAQAAQALASFPSTQRRFEYLGEKAGVKYYDDYAHHPHELTAVIETLNEWHPQARKVVAFQPHTYSRTKELYDEFMTALSQAEELVLLDIFSSARESEDPTVSSRKLAQDLEQITGQEILVLKDANALAIYCRKQLEPGDVLLTVGAGDIYQVHDLI